jgi:hypothetical protein
MSKVSISWDPPIPSTNVAGYKIYWGLESRKYADSVDVGDKVTGSVSDLDPAKTYYFAITAYNASTNESDYSAELVWDNNPPTLCGVPSAVYVAGLPGKARMPDILDGVTATDNFSVAGDITITQFPVVGTILAEAVTVAQVTATDEAGNQTVQEVAVITTPYPPLNLRFVDGNNKGPVTVTQ